MSVKLIKGNIFTSKCQTLVNTVNCVGVMGAGLALECRLRYPDMYSKYQLLCSEGKIQVGKLWLYKSTEKWILNFPTKKHWRYPSKPEYLHQGLQKFHNTYQDREIKSIAFPLLGADKGGISAEVSFDIMRRYLDKIPLQIEVYQYDPQAKDDLFDKTKEWIIGQDESMVMKQANITSRQFSTLVDALSNPEVVQLNQLSAVKGIGIKTLEKVYRVANLSMGAIDDSQQQKSFDF